VDRIAKEAALSKEVQKEDATLAKVCFTLPVLPDQPEYSPQEREQAREAGANPGGRDPITRKDSSGPGKGAHDITHLGKTSLQKLLHKYLVIPPNWRL
jgi:hypothetical protein